MNKHVFPIWASWKGWLLNRNTIHVTNVVLYTERERERERGHTFDVVHLLESSSILDVLALCDGLFDTDCDTNPGLGLSLPLASREVNSSSNSPGCIPSPAADELTLKMDSRQSLATSRASGSAPGANSTALLTWFYCQKK
jgi:hypothetical protein